MAYYPYAEAPRTGAFAARLTGRPTEGDYKSALALCVDLEKELNSYKRALEDYSEHGDRANQILSLSPKHLGKNHLQAALDEIEDLRRKI